ncbi:hypothetical protein GF407_04055 [candidate division KSB1 bacterium]|nr:hypothetical protein [candidate division KSB1 bacterium]
MFPVEWHDGWPFIQQKWMQKLFVEKTPFSAAQKLRSTWYDDFDADILDPQWTLPGFPGKKLYTFLMPAVGVSGEKQEKDKPGF